LEKLELQRLKKSLQYLESKQRELKKQHENDTRSLESIIKYLKKDMVHQFKLTDYNASIKQEIKNTDVFITHVKYIIENNFSNSI
jgi:predicted metal-dependent hydrolase